MDPLAGDSDTASSSSDSDADTPQQRKPSGDRSAPGQAAQQLQLDPEALVAGNSVLFVPEPPKDSRDQWDWWVSLTFSRLSM